MDSNKPRPPTAEDWTALAEAFIKLSTSVRKATTRIREITKEIEAEDEIRNP